MIIKKISLENIRSYENVEISFNLGSTLLAGDIGSGKTSILLAIEFGLFGLQPGQRGSSLMRNGKNFAKVVLEFEVDSKNIIVERTLKKTKTISQDYAAITINGKKEELAITELKQRVLNLLNYPSEFSKKQNILYKFTVYTPQEEMKQIILEDADTRLNTLRHVFGVDKYKTILENVSVLKLKIREEKKLYEGITSNLEEEIQILNLKEKNLLEIKEKIIDYSSELLIKIEKRKEKEEEKENLNEKIKEKNILREELLKSKMMHSSKKEKLLENKKIIEETQREIQNFKNLQFEEIKILNIEEEILEKKKQKEKLEKISLEINSELVSLNNSMEQAQKEHSKISNLENCPTCGQNVDSIYRANVLNQAHNKISKGKQRLEEIEIEKKSIFEKLKKLNLDIEFKQKELTDLKILKMKLEGIKEKENKLETLIKENIDFEKDAILLSKHIEKLNDSILEFSKHEKAYEVIQNELKNLFNEEKNSEIKLAELKKEVEVSIKSIEELKEKIKKIKEIKNKLDYISELEMWLNKKFIPVISFIEKNVMISLKYEFSKLFSDWFNILVPENFDVRLSDDFTPIVEQKDYEIDYAYLSGGERTAIALAYRLALNQVINSLMSKIKTKELVILDEPTDGFSEQQLDKMREVLEQLNVQQLLIVSHEQKIEGFVENIIRFKKEQGISFKE